jgi:hypothetical protein
MQAGFAPDRGRVVGRFSDFARVPDGWKEVSMFHFCLDCGSTVFYREPDQVVVMVGSFADPSFPPPTESGYDHRRHPWIALPDSIERDDEARLRSNPRRARFPGTHGPVGNQ